VIALVLVSHSARLAEGLAELAGQMAPDVTITPVGGLADGSLGTDFDRVLTAVEAAAETVVLYDIGSARMTAEMVVETLDDGKTRLVDGPFVEGAVAAAVAAQGGGVLDAVAAAAAGTAGANQEQTPEPGGQAEARLELTNEVGLHARPAAQLARAVATIDAKVTVSKGEHHADAASVLALMGLDARCGDVIEISATGPAAEEAVTKIRELIAANFGE
jgi:PTS hybrid protein